MLYKKLFQAHRSRILISTFLLCLTLSSFPLRRGETAAGDLDQGFGIASGKTFADFSRGDDHAFAVATQADGKIIIAGYASIPNRVFALVRYKPDGNLDTGFGTAGKVTTEFPGGFGEIHSLAIQSDGKIIAGGIAVNSFALARYNADGSLDSSFGSGGKVTTVINDLISPSMIAYALAVQSDGKIVAAGGFETTFGLARYNADGSLDTSFGSGGKLTFPDVRSGAGRGLAIQSDGKIVVSGNPWPLDEQGFTVLRFNSDGSPDSGFGSSGKIITNFTGTGGNARSLVILPDGKIVVAGSVFLPFGSFDFAIARYNRDGELDPSFGADGKVTTDFFSNDSSFDDAYTLALQSDGKLIVAGSVSRDNTLSNFALARYNADGSLDASFGSGGKSVIDFTGNFDDAFAVTIQKDGKLILAGNSFRAPVSRDFALARYNTDGSLDTSFGPKGKVLTDFNDSDDEAHGLIIQEGEKFVVTGQTTSGFALARYNGDGSLDSSFGSGGKVSTDFGNVFNTIGVSAMQSDGKIILAGNVFITGGRDFGVARFNVDGSFDSGFGSGGKVITNFSGISDDVAQAVAVQSDGKIIVAGSTNSDFALVRYNSNGTLDSGFGSGGKVVTDIALGIDSISGVAIQGDGKIVAVGVASINASNSRFALARYNKDGSLDTSFGSGGKVTTRIKGGFEGASAVAIQSDGRIVVVGNADFNFAVARYNADGSLDSGFGSDGKVTTEFSDDGRGSALAVVIQKDGKIIAAGRSSSPFSEPNFAVARYNKDGSLDTSFGSAGKVITGFAGQDEKATAVALKSDGKIIVAGSSVNFNTRRDFAIAQYENDGSLGFNFDICIEDDSNGNLLQIDSTSGDYRFTSCSTGFVLTGTGTLTQNGGKLTFEDQSAGRNVSAKMKKLKKASASIEIFSTGAKFSISDKKRSNSSCACN